MATHVVHCRTHSYTVLIDRTTPWGNPFKIGRDGTRDDVINKFQAWVERSTDPKATWIRAHVHELHGEVLGCWCAPRPCHGQVLAQLARRAVLTHD